MSVKAISHPHGLCTVCYQDQAIKIFKMAARQPREMCPSCIVIYRIKHRAVQYDWIFEHEPASQETMLASIIAELITSEEIKSLAKVVAVSAASG